MASWVSHLIVADEVLKRIPDLNRKGFCVGSIAPDCNMENEDWTRFIPSREVTHWMAGDKKDAADCERFLHEYLLQKKPADLQEEGFQWGYYAHLVTDAGFQKMIRDEKRVEAMWNRIKEHPELSIKSFGMEKTYDAVKRLIEREDRQKDLFALERIYLDTHPASGFLTEIIGLQEFPDYMDYLPPNAIVRKVGVMGKLPDQAPGIYPYVCISEAEYAAYLAEAIDITVNTIRKYRHMYE